MIGTVMPMRSSPATISGTACAAASWFTVTRTSSLPARARSATWRTVAVTSAVSVLVIDWTTTGCVDPTATGPIRTVGVALRVTAAMGCCRSGESKLGDEAVPFRGGDHAVEAEWFERRHDLGASASAAAVAQLAHHARKLVLIFVLRQFTTLAHGGQLGELLGGTSGLNRGEWGVGHVRLLTGWFEYSR